MININHTCLREINEQITYKFLYILKWDRWNWNNKLLSIVNSIVKRQKYSIIYEMFLIRLPLAGVAKSKFFTKCLYTMYTCITECKNV